MSMGGHSFHKKDWLKTALIAAAAAGTGGMAAGAAGMGPLAGMMGAGEAAGAGGLLGGAGLEAGGGMVGAGTAADIAGAPAAANAGSIGLSNFMTQFGPNLKGGMKGLGMAKQMGLFSPPPPPPSFGIPSHPQQPLPQTQVNAGSLPTYLQGRKPDDPEVIAWLKEHGQL